MINERRSRIYCRCIEEKGFICNCASAVVSSETGKGIDIASLQNCEQGTVFAWLENRGGKKREWSGRSAQLLSM